MGRAKRERLATGPVPPTLEELRARRIELELLVVEAVISARHSGLTWAQVGAGLGVSGQSVWHRYSEAVERRYR